jgi:hypothetical protein
VAHRDPPLDHERLALTRPAGSMVGRARAALQRVVPVPAAWLLAALVLTSASAALAADPTPDPAGTPHPPTCAERFPEDGPGGIDLKLGCIVGEVVGVYVPGQAKPPAPLSSYAILVGIMLIGLASVIVLGTRLVARLAARSAGRRLAPVLPSEWWVCATCRSVNGAQVEHCYSCRSTRPEGPALMTDDRPDIPQTFGSRRKRG